MRFFLLTIFVIMSISIISMNAKDNNDDINDDNIEIWDDDFWSEDESSFSTENPTIEIEYGFGKPSINRSIFPNDFAKTDDIELRFGYTEKTENLNRATVFSYEFKHVFLGNASSQWKNDDDKLNEINTDAWRYGYASSTGYGYKFSENIDLTLYSTKAFSLTKINFIDSVPDILEQKRMDYFGNEFRVGSYFEGGMRFQLYAPFAITAAYQRGIVMPRWMFWYWSGSEIIEGVGNYFIDEFIEKIIDSSPLYAPVVNFILKNAYSYGFYELRKSNMNWPFDTETPYMYDNIKVGVSFAF